MYDRIIAYVKSQPWAIRDREAAIIQDVLCLRSAGVKFTAEELTERIGAPEAKRDAPAQSGGGGVAVVPIWGVIGHRANELRAISSSVGTSTEILGAQIAMLAADSNVKAIVLDINSPGGGVFGLPEVAAQVREARAKKPVIAVANALTASAAYWIASQASEIVVTPSAQIGSIGVYSMHENHRERLATEGIDVTVISAGKYKTEQHPFAPLSEDARAAMQDQVDAYYAMFTKDVAKGRGISVETVRNGFGEGRTVNAGDAVRLGMADRAGTLDDVIAELVTSAPSAKAAPVVVVTDREIAAEVPTTPIQAAVIEETPAIVAETEPIAPPAWQQDIDQRKLKLRILELG